MCSCLRQSFSLPKNLIISKRNSSTKLFTVLSPVHDKLNNNYYTNNVFFTKTNKSKQIQNRYFSLDNINSSFESIRSSEAAKAVTNALIATHDFSGLNWSFTIIAASALVKLFIGFPCGLYQQYLVAKLELIKIEVDNAAKKLKEVVMNKAVRGKWTNEKFQLELRKEVIKVWKTLVVKNNCHPFKITILFLCQLPLWLLLTIAIRSLALDAQSRKMENPVAELQLQVGGPFWCSNLTVSDPTLILPTINALAMLATTELALSTRIEAQYYKGFFRNKILPNLLRAFAIVFFLISSVSPAGLSLYWTSSSVITLGQNFLLLSPRLRRFFKIPKTTNEVDKPYSYAFNNFIAKLQNTFIWKK